MKSQDIVDTSVSGLRGHSVSGLRGHFGVFIVG